MNQKKSKAPGVLLIVFGIIIAIIGLSLSIWGCSTHTKYTTKKSDLFGIKMTFAEDVANNPVAGFFGGVMVLVGAGMVFGGKSSIKAAREENLQQPSTKEVNFENSTPSVARTTPAAQTTDAPESKRNRAALIVFIIGMVSSLSFVGVPVLIVSILLNAGLAKSFPEHSKTYSTRVILSIIGILLSIAFIVLYVVFLIPYLTNTLSTLLK